MSSNEYSSNPFVSDATSSCCPDSKQAWFELARSFKILPKNQINNLLAQVRRKENEDEAIQRIVNSHLLLLTERVTKKTSESYDFIDLIGDGYVGLVKAVKGYRPTMKVEFITYATVCIDSALKRAKIKYYWAIRPPEQFFRKTTTIHFARQLLHDDLGREPTSKEIALHIDCPVEEVVRISQLLHNILRPKSLDEPVGEFIQTDTLSDILEGFEPGTSHQAVSNIEYSLVESVILNDTRLSPMRQEILKRLILEEQERPRMVKAISEMFGHSRQGVYQNINRAIEILGEILAEEGFAL